MDEILKLNFIKIDTYVAYVLQYKVP